MALVHRHIAGVEAELRPLACDAAVKAANGTAALAAYRDTLDPSVLVVPPDATLVRYRALSTAELRRLEREAGRHTYRGERVAAEVGDAARAAGDDERARNLGWAAAADALGDDDHAAWQDYLAWAERRSELMALAGTVEIISQVGEVLWAGGCDGSAVDLRRLEARNRGLTAELAASVSRLSELAPPGK